MLRKDDDVVNFLDLEDRRCGRRGRIRRKGGFEGRGGARPSCGFGAEMKHHSVAFGAVDVLVLALDDDVVDSEGDEGEDHGPRCQMWEDQAPE